ncbi:MAG: hypothetical protein A2Z88_08895 [Omnitrophica WOR_2 bacterium GWA2_47_8]|nr:MAG: hypothetical protein A2Z88_08895 [Omnitrophica WOR_2 bacterium GWA2_47_8]
MSILIHSLYLKTIQDLAKKKKVPVYLVGGFLRDSFLNRPCADFDFAVKKGAVPLARRLADTIKGAFVLLDDEFGCGRVVIRQASNLARPRHPLKADGGKSRGEVFTFDFADYRAPTFKQDLAHRDFTINTLAIDLQKISQGLSESVLFSKKPLKDLKSRTIKMVSAKAFKEDPLRLLRAFSLRAQLDFKIEKKTLAQIKKDKDLIGNVSSERIREEVFKILSTPAAGQILKEMDKIGLLENIIPQISVMFNVKQGGYHHLDVWPHSLETVSQLDKVLEEFKDDRELNAYLNETLSGNHKRVEVLKLAALLHDIGKPKTKKKEDNGRMSFHGHEHVGRGIVRHIAKQLKLSTHERHALEDMVLWHLRPGYLSNFKKPSERSVFRYFRDTKDEAASILVLSLADQRSTRGPLTSEADQKHHQKICLGVLKKYFDKKKEKPFVRLINGKDLIKKLKLEPSPLFGKILSAVDEAQVLGKITTKEEALELAKKVK